MWHGGGVNVRLLVSSKNTCHVKQEESKLEFDKSLATLRWTGDWLASWQDAYKQNSFGLS